MSNIDAYMKKLWRNIYCMKPKEMVNLVCLGMNCMDLALHHVSELSPTGHEIMLTVLASYV